MISKTFYQQLRSSERQSLVGPPESMREHVVAASKAMRNGNWLASRNFIINEKMNAKVQSIDFYYLFILTIKTCYRCGNCSTKVIESEIC